MTHSAPLKYIAVFSLLTLITGCQKFAYQPAEGDNTASITFTSDNLAVQPFVCVPGEGFKATEYAVSQQPFESDFFTQFNDSLKKKAEVETTVEASKSTKVGFSFRERKAPQDKVAARGQCRVAVLFNTEAGMSYSAHFSLLEGQCALQLSKEAQPVTDAAIVPWECN